MFLRLIAGSVASVRLVPLALTRAGVGSSKVAVTSFECAPLPSWQKCPGSRSNPATPSREQQPDAEKLRLSRQSGPGTFCEANAVERQGLGQPFVWEDTQVATVPKSSSQRGKTYWTTAGSAEIKSRTRAVATSQSLRCSRGKSLRRDDGPLHLHHLHRLAMNFHAHPLSAKLDAWS